VSRFAIIFGLSALLTASCLSSAQEAPPDSTPLLKPCNHKNHSPCIDKPPAVIHAPDPEYSVAAHNAKIQGEVVLHATIGTDGLAHDIQVVRPLGYGLDELAAEAVKKWTFKPAQSSGKPVPAKITIEVPFLYH
jgi:TonB family protein